MDSQYEPEYSLFLRGLYTRAPLPYTTGVDITLLWYDTQCEYQAFTKRLLSSITNDFDKVFFIRTVTVGGTELTQIRAYEYH
jgi:hypothetical protein